MIVDSWREMKNLGAETMKAITIRFETFLVYVHMSSYNSQRSLCTKSKFESYCECWTLNTAYQVNLLDVEYLLSEQQCLQLLTLATAVSMSVVQKNTK